MSKGRALHLCRPADVTFFDGGIRGMGSIGLCAGAFFCWHDGIWHSQALSMHLIAKDNIDLTEWDQQCQHLNQIMTNPGLRQKVWFLDSGSHLHTRHIRGMQPYFHNILYCHCGCCALKALICG